MSRNKWKGSLTVVGTGIKAVAHSTNEARRHIEQADKVYFVCADVLTSLWIQSLNQRAESLHSYFNINKSRYDSYEEIIEHLLVGLRKGWRVCVAFYGHPGVFVYPSHQVIKRARDEGYDAVMLPGISAEDCLFADVGLDPARTGCQSFEATDFLVYKRRPDTSCALILWQVGVIGLLNHVPVNSTAKGVGLLTSFLLDHYPATHKAVIYEAALDAACPPRIDEVELGTLTEQTFSPFSTLYVAPATELVPDKAMLKKLRMPHPPRRPVQSKESVCK